MVVTTVQKVDHGRVCMETKWLVVNSWGGKHYV